LYELDRVMDGDLDQAIEAVATFFQAKELEATQGGSSLSAEPP
jgi:hypothetical protein